MGSYLRLLLRLQGRPIIPDAPTWDMEAYTRNVMKVLPEHYRRLLSPSDRRALGQLTKEESIAKGETRLEKDLQRLVYLELNRRNVFFHYSRTDKKTRSLLGTPDFAFCSKGRYVAIECKTATGNLTKQQLSVSRQIKDSGGMYFVVRSFEQFIYLLHTHQL